MKLHVAVSLAQARAHHLCEGCGQYDQLDPHHRLARGMGGVHRAAAEAANDVRNFLMLCRYPCHESTEAADTWRECEEKGWRFRHGFGVDPLLTPAFIRTVNGAGWWYLTEDGGYRWADLPHDYRIHLERTTDGATGV